MARSTLEGGGAGLLTTGAAGGAGAFTDGFFRAAANGAGGGGGALPVLSLGIGGGAGLETAGGGAADFPTSSIKHYSNIHLYLVRLHGFQRVEVSACHQQKGPRVLVQKTRQLAQPEQMHSQPSFHFQSLLLLHLNNKTE